jgi:hypothetical protein
MNTAMILLASLSALASGLDLGLVADKAKLGDRGVLLEGELNPVDDDLWTTVATHHIHADAHKRKERGEPRTRGPSASGALTEAPLEFNYAPAVTVRIWRPL